MTDEKTIEQEIEDQAILAAAASFPPRALIMADAIGLTCGDRNAAYGEPVGNMAHIAAIYNAITGQSISARDVAVMHQATKQARRYKNPMHRDSYVDGAAYGAIEWECAMAERKPDAS